MNNLTEQDLKDIAYDYVSDNFPEIKDLDDLYYFEFNSEGFEDLIRDEDAGISSEEMEKALTYLNECVNKRIEKVKEELEEEEEAEKEYRAMIRMYGETDEDWLRRTCR